MSLFNALRTLALGEETAAGIPPLRQRVGAAHTLARYALDPRRHGWRNEVTAIQVDHVTLRWPNLPDDLCGLRIAQLSDLHACPWVKEDYLRQAADLALGQQPDLIVLTGDYVQLARDAQVYAQACARAMRDLRAPLGVYAILGNHDYWRDPRLIIRAFSDMGIPTLVNQSRAIRVGQADLWLVGLDDARHGMPHLPRALADVPAAGFKILLAHEPDIADIAHLYDFQLQLSGHSHGGQVLIPGVPTSWLPFMGRKYPRGLYRVGGMWLYTNRGLGSGFPPIRHNCPPEVTILKLELE